MVINCTGCGTLIICCVLVCVCVLWGKHTREGFCQAMAGLLDSGPALVGM